MPRKLTVAATGTEGMVTGTMLAMQRKLMGTAADMDMVMDIGAVILRRLMEVVVVDMAGMVMGTGAVMVKRPTGEDMATMATTATIR
ncbi:hypothetical protein NP233_g5798 [Leucocoprinus birnbaumii]|uniref:Uncharacterized protein n=1 Tax=Leucocoprinus birnbaumii TaxID=56174 RepID=A0AAD5VVP4_9AGAR|nr:hypothetical protein NP233_g5798 [Leucocoprinus birnbaumii]